MTAAQPKSLRIVHGGESCTVLLYEGLEHSSLVHALSSRFKLSQATFHLTLEGMDDIVPLSSALPGGLTLTLHTEVFETPISNSQEKTFAAVDRTLAPEELRPTGASATVAYAALVASNVSSTVSSSTASPLLAAASLNGPEEFQQTSEGNVPLVQRQEREPATPFPRPITEDSERQQSANSMYASFVAINDVAVTVDRFSRLSTELANERTLLAWVRTGLAAIRTTFTYYDLSADLAIWRGSIIFSQIAMMTVVLFSAVAGAIRYNKIKSVLRQAEPPQEFGRISMHWFNALVVMSSIATAAGVYARTWV